MGQSASTEESPELREVQSLAASTGALPRLQKAFSLLSDSETKSIPVNTLQKCFELTSDNLVFDQSAASTEMPVLFSHMGSTIVDLIFTLDKNGINWIEFLKGYTKCCGRTVASISLNNLLRVFSKACSAAGCPVNLQFELCDDDYKISGSLSSCEIVRLLWVCWLFSWDSMTLKLKLGKSKRKSNLPSISHLVLSAIESCLEGSYELDFWDSNVSDLDVQLPASKLHLWALKTLPNLADCFVQFVHQRVCCFEACEGKSVTSLPSSHESSTSSISEANLLTSGRAWAISLTLRSPLYEEISNVCFPTDVEDINENLIYRSSHHGKSLSRFWSNVDGYNGPLLVLISAREDKNNLRSWIIAALTYQGFESKETFYGNSGSLYALTPVFHSLMPSGREKNFVYSHLHPTARLYEAHPKPVGIAFGGSSGNERIFMDEDFAKVTIRHHAVDKTYQHGALFPNQGYLLLEASVLEVEVWGLGGTSARKIQAAHQKRENLFTEQRRKVDLKTFSNWEDSPEKLMMDMMSNPNAVRREER